MALVETNNPSSLKIKLNLGLVDGKEKTRSKSYSYVKPDATSQDIYDIAQALMALQKYDIIEVIKVDNTELNDVIE
ncbi:MAG: DUF1659 domain-containing protein [Peptostreptococcaceae bacterium]